MILPGLTRHAQNSGVPFPLPILTSVGFFDTGSPLFMQERVGRDKKKFVLIKFRTMNVGTESVATHLAKSASITRFGSFLRKTKLDELPQLINIIRGEMSVVGPRPETPNFVALYNEEQQEVLNVRPGLTDYATLNFINESEILAEHEDPEKAYVEIKMPKKLALNLGKLSLPLKMSFLSNLNTD